MVKQSEFEKEISKFNHSIEEKVRFHEVDLLGVCNNAVYLNYFEDARLNYLESLVKKYSLKNFLSDNSFVIMARNEIDYLASAHLNDILNIYTKIEKVSKSSFSLLHLIIRKSDDTKIAHGKGVLVHIDKITKKSKLLPEEFHRAVVDFEGV